MDSLPQDLSFDPKQSRFLLVGTSVYDRDPENLQALPSVLNNLTALKNIFISADIVGAPESSVIIVHNPRDKAEFSARLVEAATQANDLFFFYYAGHGVLGRETNKLYLGTVATTEEHADFDGFPFDEVRLILSSKTKAKKRVVILDCCFSGLALDDAMGTVNNAVDSNITIKSTYSIASAPPNRLSIAEPGKQYTAFSGELIDLLESDTGGAEKYLSADLIFEKLKGRIDLKPNLPEPRRKALYDGGVLVLARNRVGPPAVEAQFNTLYRLTAERITAIESKFDELRAELHAAIATAPKETKGFWRSVFSAPETRFEGQIPLKLWNDMPAGLQSFLDRQYAAYINSKYIITLALLTACAYVPLLFFVSAAATQAAQKVAIFFFSINVSLQIILAVLSVFALMGPGIISRNDKIPHGIDPSSELKRNDFVRKAMDDPAGQFIGIPITVKVT